MTSLHAPRDHTNLPYSHDLLPNPRDIQSPWGCMRAYEWGPRTGRKALMIHGLSTPSPALAKVGQTLVAGGCRVMIIDLWGRGFSDTPTAVPHDARLYVSQILLAISTSSLSWTGSDTTGFAIIGYSMGGALAMAFAKWFPQLVSQIVLMAPGGLYQNLPPGYRDWRVRYPWLFPRGWVVEYTRMLLNGGTAVGSLWTWLFGGRLELDGVRPAAESQKQHEWLDVAGLVDWEIDHHPGFVASVSSALAYAPVVRQHSLWREVRGYLEGSSETILPHDTPSRLLGSKILLLLGRDDAVLHQDYREDIDATLGKDNLVVQEFDGGHGFPILHGELVGTAILDCLQRVKIA